MIRARCPTRAAPSLPEGRRNVLYAVRRRGEATAEQVAESLGMTVSGARQHLSALVDDGLAEATETAEPTGRAGAGRALVYAVTPTGDALFPKAYGELTNELLGYLDDEEPETVDRALRPPPGRPHGQRPASPRRSGDRWPTRWPS